MSKTIIFLFIFTTKLIIGQNPFIGKKNELINTMVSSFENQICKYYSVKVENTNIAYYLFIKDIISNKENIQAITSEEELELLEFSLSELKGFVWLSNKEKRERFYSNNGIVLNYNHLDKKTKKYFDKLKTTDNIFSVNYFDNYSELLINNSKNQDLKDIIITLREIPSTNPSTTALAFLNLKKTDYKDNAIKTFIAFEFYYSILNSTNRNE